MTRSTALVDVGRDHDGLLRVVCADDAEDSLALLRLQLALLSDVEVVDAVTNGQRAVDAASRLEPDLVVLDVAMPGMDGLEAAQEIRARGVPTKILILSAFSAERMEDDALAAGADAYLEKSAEPDALMAEVRRLFPARSLPSATPPIARLEPQVSESGLRTALETLPDFFGIYRPIRGESGEIVDFVYEFVNGAGLKILDRPLDETVGRGMVELLPSNVELGLFDRYVQVVQTGETDRFDLPWLDDSGVQGSFFVTAAEMDGRLVILARDVTEEHRARAEAERLELRYRAAVDAMLDSVIIASSVRDDAGRIVDFRIDYINPVAEIAGRPRDELVGMLFSDAWPGARIGPTPTLDLYRKVVETGEPVVRDSFRYVDNIGGRPVEAWFDLRAMKLGDGFIQNFRDVTERVRAEKQLVERAAALARSNADLQEFSYAVSHDLGAPMHTVLGFTQLLRSQLGDLADADAAQYLDYIESGVQRASRMLADLLAYSRVQTQTVPAEPIDLADVVAEVEANMRGRISESGARIYTDALPTVRGDRTQLVQLLQNLVGNAITYVAPGISPRVHIAAAPTPDGWRISVTDNGIGISEREREQAFRLFHRVGDPSAHPGSGLGLALCRRIVTRHGGRIWLAAAPGGGTTATFTLPDNPPTLDEPAAFTEDEPG